jgi:hypothetical protein
VGLNVSDVPTAARSWVRRYRWTWPSIRDPNRELEGKLGVYGQPVIVLVDARGYVAGAHIGPGNAKAWNALAAKL